MAELTELPPPSPYPYLADGSRYADRLVRLILADGDVPEPGDGDGDLAMSAATFLAHMLFLAQMASGADPHRASALLQEKGRGPDLARRFLGAGTVEICCDYCGGLMVTALAAATAGQLGQLHGSAEAPRHWDALAAAIIPQAA